MSKPVNDTYGMIAHNISDRNAIHKSKGVKLARTTVGRPYGWIVDHKSLIK